LPAHDALLVDSIVAAAVAPSIAAVGSRAPVIAIVHQQPGGVDHLWVRSSLQRSLDLLLYRRVAGVIAVSDWLGDQLVAAGVNRGRITLAPPGCEPTVAHAPSPRSGNEVQVVAVSNWTRNKNVHLIVEAFVRLEPGITTLHLVGDTTIDPAYARRVRAHIAQGDLRDRVIEHGSLAPADVERIIRSSDVFVHASRHESYGSAVAEAMGAGVPVVAFAVDNLPYLIGDGREGLLVPFGDISWMASALGLLLRDRGRRQAMGNAARDRAMRFPTWSESAERFFGAIRRLIDASQVESRR
jgi:glycosyltransferase involved in cell wall biosynthesis